MKRFPALLALVLIAAQAFATTVKPMTVERLTRASGVVARARAVASWSEWNPGRTLIYTYTRFQVLEPLKGQAAGTFVVKQLGGTAGEITQKVAGVRGWRAGEEAVLFLNRSSESPGAMVVTGLMQGDFRVRQRGAETVVSNGVADVQMLQRGAVQTFRGSELSLQELKTRIRGAL